MRTRNWLTTFVAVAGHASAATIYSDFSAGNGYDGTTEWQIGGSVSSVLATSFVANITSAVGSIDVAVFNLSGKPNGGYSITLAQDSAGAPGAVIETISGISFPNPGGILSVNSVLNPVLTSGTKYWIYLANALAPEGQGGWYWNNASPAVDGIKFEDSSHPTTWFTNSFQPSPAFDVIGAASAPEPGAALFVATGLITLRYSRRRKFV